MKFLVKDKVDNSNFAIATEEQFTGTGKDNDEFILQFLEFISITELEYKVIKLKQPSIIDYTKRTT